ncbi:hypothetical protein HWQ46_03170 [Shewanella sp. D64]|uniref:hypothetical protein n=1 Tax=unclassified Shewanella TaxID=196818 RepID=UPI0022BA4E08|nr:MULTISPECIES: hypothetical protein [unclassified Shewanella]MEC4724548.1 hypothetical protein [Shewanella sp. D64]MEC4736675.1 hypothetical protein [Shewanella sp. E94]WBJ94655.1 hypothetical protein HWQ47_22810 [Shewanella sp. MTB7]
MNKVNELVMMNLAYALRCAAVLDKNGITMNQVILDRRKPCIEVINNKKLEQLTPVSIAISNQNGRRYERLSAEIEGTNVQWLQPINN